ncbi:MAG: phospholipase D-like domain-containing protein [Candidatus Thorarchaeota archaeon]|jgi:cardiolipin synthase
MNKVQILATGPELVTESIRGIEPVLKELIASAKEELQIVSYVLTPSALDILEMIREAARRGVRITLVVNQRKSLDKKIVSWLAGFENEFQYVRVIDYEDPEGKCLHAKVIVSDRKEAIVGSANLTWGGMVGNYEIGVLLEGEVAWKLGSLIDKFAAYG